MVILNTLFAWLTEAGYLAGKPLALPRRGCAPAAHHAPHEPWRDRERRRRGDANRHRARAPARRALPLHAAPSGAGWRQKSPAWSNLSLPAARRGGPSFPARQRAAIARCGTPTPPPCHCGAMARSRVRLTYSEESGWPVAAALAPPVPISQAAPARRARGRREVLHLPGRRRRVCRAPVRWTNSGRGRIPRSAMGLWSAHAMARYEVA